ncbi:MAG: hypothetical protein QOE11_2832 [Solirubrobacteraceae bacterium]|jgi:hypothetical protein|nr:hypothetical protein [Solirubrobacteraceae bacterium]
MSGEPEWYERILELQLRENPEAWARVVDEELDGEQLRLGFIYLAPGKREADALAAFLREQTDYDVEVHQQRVGELKKKKTWLVVGATQPAFVTLEMLDVWVEWMVAAGAAEGPCAFDGWSAQAEGPLLAEED